MLLQIIHTVDNFDSCRTQQITTAFNVKVRLLTINFTTLWTDKELISFENALQKQFSIKLCNDLNCHVLPSNVIIQEICFDENSLICLLQRLDAHVMIVKN